MGDSRGGGNDDDYYDDHSDVCAEQPIEFMEVCSVSAQRHDAGPGHHCLALVFFQTCFTLIPTSVEISPQLYFFFSSLVQTFIARCYRSVARRSSMSFSKSSELANRP